jgi:2-polyprenyl-3-methyl-5-hydroxy-6-metoxy-1,4-benzoquinol methylase
MHSIEMKKRKDFNLMAEMITNASVIKSWETASSDVIAQHGDEGDFARKYLLNPTLWNLLGEVQNKKILDAGCGQGYLCRLLAHKGALVTGIEPSENWFCYALAREQTERSGITYLQQDLSTFQGYENTFDLVVSNMVLMDIPDYKNAIRNCVAALKPGGRFIFSITHPCFEESATTWTEKRHVAVSSYFRDEAIENRYGYTFHRPLSTYLNLVMQKGCTLWQIVEPQLPQDLVQDDPANERNVYVPQFLVVGTIKN